MAIPTDVEHQALHAFRDVFLPFGWERVEREGIVVCLHPLPIAKLVEPVGLDPDGVETAIEQARSVVRERGGSLLAWCIAPEDAPIGDRLEALGLVNEETPGFEVIENAMALVHPPTGEWSSDIVVAEVESFEDFAASNHVSATAFEFPPAMLDEMDAAMAEQYADYSRPGNSACQFNALIDDVVVGTAAGVRGPAGVNLFGGSVLAEARGRGVYRALMHARWKFAVDCGTPALTIQAGRMSMPIAEQLGFTYVGAIKIYVDDFAGA